MTTSPYKDDKLILWENKKKLNYCTEYYIRRLPTPKQKAGDRA